ncbi:hypothetical protein ACFYVL_42635 [Streptomyces sp. NPDC004111]|uniref:hypothetical protein n=1 Tax=Streptomyces sp. NPDC004111 TaxID=3364690 RepID=UPI0036CF7B46
MNDEHRTPPRAELSSAYWLDSPVLAQHGLCGCSPDDRPPPATPPHTWRPVMIGTACALIVTVLGLTVL